MATQPTPEDRFRFGPWTVGWPARDPFGDPTRPASAESQAVADLLADRSAFPGFDADSPAQRGAGVLRLTQPALEHLVGAR